MHNLLNGRFAPGNPGGPGRPKRSVEEQYLIVFREEVSPDAWREVVKRALADALDGDHKARVFLARFLMPPDGILPDDCAPDMATERNAAAQALLSTIPHEVFQHAAEREQMEKRQTVQEVRINE